MVYVLPDAGKYFQDASDAELFCKLSQFHVVVADEM
jgi:hypothetical protein